MLAYLKIVCYGSLPPTRTATIDIGLATGRKNFQSGWIVLYRKVNHWRECQPARINSKVHWRLMTGSWECTMSPRED